MPKVSIILRTKDRPSMLQRALKCISKQTFGDYEIIVINDGGDQIACDQVVADLSFCLPRQTRIVHHRDSLGMEAASNIGVKTAQSDMIVLHDDDDSWEPLFLAEMIAALDKIKHPSVRGIACFTTRVEESINKHGDIIELSRSSLNGTLKDLTLTKMIVGNLHPPISFLYHRSVHDEIGFYDESLPVLGDWDFYLRFYSAFEVLLLPLHLANYHIRPDAEGTLSNTVITSLDKHQFYNQLILNRLIRGTDPNHKGLNLLAAMSMLIKEQRGEKLNDVFQRYLIPISNMKHKNCNKPIVWGAGIMGRKVIALLRFAGIEPLAVTDGRGLLDIKDIDGVRYIPLSHLRDFKPDSFLIGSIAFSEVILSQISELDYVRDRCVPIFSPV